MVGIAMTVPTIACCSSAASLSDRLRPAPADARGRPARAARGRRSLAVLVADRGARALARGRARRRLRRRRGVLRPGVRRDRARRAAGRRARPGQLARPVRAADRAAPRRPGAGRRADRGRSAPARRSRSTRPRSSSRPSPCSRCAARPRRASEPAPSRGDLRIRQGFAFVRRHVWLWGTFAAAAIAYLLFLGPTEVLLPYVVKNDLGGRRRDLGLVFAAGGIGSVGIARR